MTCVVPSPLRTTSSERATQRSVSAASNSTRPAASRAGPVPEDTQTRESEVDWSASTLAQLNEASALRRSIGRSTSRGTGTSVSTKASIVAISGSIMPAPFAKPTNDPPHARALRSLGKRSVVMILRAAGRAEPRRSASAASGRASSMRATGRRQPMTPVESGSTASAPPSSLSASAAPRHTSSLAATPSPAAQTLEILLLTTRACKALPAARRCRPTLTGAPGKRFWVKVAAQLSVGWSSAMSVRFMTAVAPSSSAGENVKPHTPTRKPSGSCCVSSCCKCASSLTVSLAAEAGGSLDERSSGGELGNRDTPSALPARRRTNGTMAWRGR
mmetsp:Transcript_82120/g.163560  ORF Transcript_82120/g.163560 Transcript_82120/m.163560 type:complete len:331 (-) Transcript_82120:27-1019(-)